MAGLSVSSSGGGSSGITSANTQSIWLQNFSAYGTFPSSKIPRFSATIDSDGSGLFTYTDDTVYGAKIVMLQRCLIWTSVCFTSDINSAIGISRNVADASTSTGIGSVAASSRMMYVYATLDSNTNLFGCGGAPIIAEVGDIFRPHTGAAPTPGAALACTFHFMATVIGT